MPALLNDEVAVAPNDPVEKVPRGEKNDVDVAPVSDVLPDTVRAGVVSEPFDAKVELATPPKEAVLNPAELTNKKDVVAFVAVIAGVEIVPFVAIVVVPVAPNAVEPKKLLEFANWEVPRAEMEPAKI
ncbi:MAG TPA: hypothetical protein VNI78_00500 [Vicinamibacterales bacterium]|nr:hypothetical protein [Vicinamibacterales bacterium]